MTERERKGGERETAKETEGGEGRGGEGEAEAVMCKNELGGEDGGKCGRRTS